MRYDGKLSYILEEIYEDVTEPKFARRLRRMLLSSPDSIVDLYAALYWFSHDYHSGQGSKGYRLMSTLGYEPGPCETSDRVRLDLMSDLYYGLFEEMLTAGQIEA